MGYVVTWFYYKMSTGMTYLLLRVYVYFWSEVFRFWGGWVGLMNSEHCSDFKIGTYFWMLPKDTGTI